MSIRLQERDAQILTHLGRYRITTPEVLFRLFFSDQTEEAMKSTLKRLRRKDGAFVESAKLYPRGNQVYYHLGLAGAAHLGLSERAAQPIADHETLVRTLGHVLFSCAGPSLRPKFSAEEFRRVFPGALVEGSAIARRFPYDAYYLDVDELGVRRLGRMLVENGGSELVTRAKSVVREDEEVLASFILEGRYTLALVVASETKADAVRRQLARAALSEMRPVRVLIEAHEPLLGLLAGGA